MIIKNMAAGSSSTESLKDLCIRALRDHLQEAKRTCDLLEGITESPVTAETRELLLKQRMCESKARVSYDRVRLQLFDTLRLK